MFLFSTKWPGLGRKAFDIDGLLSIVRNPSFKLLTGLFCAITAKVHTLLQLIIIVQLV